jgi:hypothetical protein
VIDIPGNSNLVHYLYVARERIVVPITTLTGKNTVRIIASISILVGKELIGVIKDPLGHRVSGMTTRTPMKSVAETNRVQPPMNQIITQRITR